jgi:hypothetical protein
MSSTTFRSQVLLGEGVSKGSGDGRGLAPCAWDRRGFAAAPFVILARVRRTKNPCVILARRLPREESRKFVPPPLPPPSRG